MSADPRGAEPLYTAENYNPEDSMGASSRMCPGGFWPLLTAK